MKKILLILIISMIMSCNLQFNVDELSRINPYSSLDVQRDLAMQVTFDILDCIDMSYDSLDWAFNDTIVSTKNFICMHSSRTWGDWAEQFNYRLERQDSAFEYQNPYEEKRWTYDSVFSTSDSVWIYDNWEVESYYIDSVKMIEGINNGEYKFDSLYMEVYHSSQWVDVIEIMPRWYLQDNPNGHIGFGSAPYKYTHQEGTKTVHIPPLDVISKFMEEFEEKYCTNKK